MACDCEKMYNNGWQIKFSIELWLGSIHFFARKFIHTIADEPSLSKY